MKREWVIKKVGTDLYYAGKHRHSENPVRDMFATFYTINADKILRYANQATALIALQEIKEPCRYTIESHFIIGE
jgi:hypothetical protein